MTPREDHRYSTALCKGQGLIAETLVLLDAWEQGMDAATLGRKALGEGLLSKATASRLKDIVSRVFAYRYLRGEPPPALALRALVEKRIPPDRLNQLLLIHSARALPELHDFITEVYWPSYASGVRFIRRDQAVDFFKKARLVGRLEAEWTETSRTKIARYLLSALEDFRLLGPMKGDRREMLPFRISRFTVLYLAHDLHFSGLSDTALVRHPDWMLFGLTPSDVVGELIQSASGQWIVQDSGQLLQISWKHRSMEEFVDGIAEGTF
jgi:hypothetical protein